MATKSEDVLLQVREVRFKKTDGTLYLMNERLAFIIEHRNTVSVSHKYVDIKMQKISPEGKPKVQLQLVLHDGSTSTFQFVNHSGLQAQVKDRDSVKNSLQELLVKFKQASNKELEEKNKLLSENPSLLQLYRDLVIPQVITAEEFWSQYAEEYKKKQETQSQEIGVSGAFLADVKPCADGLNVLKYNLTPDIIACVFKTYPAVRQKHSEFVPNKLSEEEFWTKFFQSHYFHRDQMSTVFSERDPFRECATIDEQEMNKNLKKGVDDPLVNISEFTDNVWNGSCDNEPDTRDTPVENIVHQNMIKRFNQHSIMVLRACETVRQFDSIPIENNQKRKLEEKVNYDDLSENQADEPGTNQLDLNKVDRYFNGPVPSSSRDGKNGNMVEGCRKLLHSLNSWSGTSKQHTSLLSPASAVSALGELSPGGLLMKSYNALSLTPVAPPLAKELKTLYSSLCELLRLFWACFPPTDENLEKKAVRMHEALRRFHASRVKPFEDKVIREYSPMNQQLTSHLNQLLNAAYRRFETWQQRRRQSMR